MVRLSIPYPTSPPQKGIWGEKTSLENYCEEDYLQTKYIAELINTLTNLSYCIYAWHGVAACRQKGRVWPDALQHFGIAGVGIFSAAFHGTIKLRAQWADDLSMFFATAIVLHRVMTFGESAAYSRNFALGLSAILVAIAVYHCWAIEVIAHQATFVIMVWVVAWNTRKLIRERVRDPRLQKRMKKLAFEGTVVILTAWVLWNVDNVTCTYLRQIRRAIGMPWGFLLELHGWWHILTAIAVYYYFALIELLTVHGDIATNLEQSEAYAWPVSSRLKRFKED